MSGIPPLPPLRIKEADGSPNVIPVFQITLSNGLTLYNNGGGKVTIDGSGSQGPAGPAGTVTIGSGITGGATPGYLLIVSDNSVIGQIDSGTFQRAIAFPISTGSGGTGRTTIGSAHTILGVNSSEASLSYYAILGSNNVSIVKSGTSIIVSALTANISGKQDSISFPLVIGSGGTGTVLSGSATTLVGMNSSSSSYDYYFLLGSNSTVVSRSANAYVISTITNGATGGGNGVVGSGTAGDLAYYAQAGTAVTYLPIGSAHTILGVNSSEASHTYYAILGSNNATVTKAGTAIYISADTGTGSGGSGASTANTYVVTDFTTDLSNEFRLVQSGNSITISTAGNLIIINATTNPAGAGGTQTIRIPMAILTVKLNSANAFYNAKSGVSVDEAHMTFVDSGLGIATYWCEVPYNINATPNWNLVMRHTPDSGAGGNVAMTVCAQVVSDGSVLDANTSVILSARSFSTYASGTLALVKMATGVIDNTLGLAQNQILYVIAQRLGNDAGDTVNANWNLKSLSLECDVNS